MFEAIASNSWIFLTLVGILGLVVGSFLNVIIHRLPIMVERDFRLQCFDYMKQVAQDKSIYNLLLPASHCPSCDALLKWHHNIPIISYLFLRGRCAHCQAKIRARYLIVELLTVILSIIVAIEMGPSFSLLVVLFFTWLLIAISFIDIENQLVPDVLSLTLLWLGLLASCFGFFTNSFDAILGAVIGYSFFWVIAQLFKWVRGQEGIGRGDFKLLAAAGAWTGWQILPFTILASSILGLIVGATFLVVQRKSRTTPIPFGPFIAIAAWIGLLWGFDITQHYLQIYGISWSNV